MTFWLVDTSGVSVHAGKFDKFILMPEYNERDYASAQSMLAVKRMLKEADDTQPPERLELVAQTIWRFVDGMAKDDIICAVEKEGDKPTIVYFAQVTGAVAYDAAMQKHVLPVQWFQESASMMRLKPYSRDLHHVDAWPSVIDDSKFRQALANHLPLPGNRFSKWTWVIIVLAAVKVISMFFTEQGGGL